MYYTLLRLQKCICDDSVRIIGVWGMPGVGKTTLLENLNNVPALESLFKIIIFVTVSQKWSPEEVRGKIARRLGLDIERETVETARSMVFEKMKDMKYLLILDDVWEKVNLHQIGVPMNNDNTKGKLVLASRFLGVCQGMNTEEDIGVKPLKRQEAWELFVEKVGEIPSDIEPVAKDVVDQCGNLPIAILAVGGQLRGKQGIQIWNNKLKELCSPSNTDIGLNDDVTKLLKLSYDYLPEERLQRCFLYCALFPVGHDIYVDYLIQCWKGEGLLTYNRSFADAHNEGHTILDKLIDCSLLVKSLRPEYVRMHEVSRHMALKIMQQSLVKAGCGLTIPPETTEWEEGIQKVSLMYNKLSDLPEQPNCNQLSTLFLQFNMELKSIPDEFFLFMNCLRVLDLSETQICVLPKSLSNLSTLQDLYLENCIHLTSLPAGVGETLEKLELLDIRGTGIRRLPNEIGAFPRLRCLHMSSTSFYINIEGGLQIPRDLIRRDKLEELIVDSEGDPAWDEKAQAVIDELVKLTGLNALRFIFPDVACLESFIKRSQSWRGQGWRSFQFDIGHHYGKQPDGGYSIGRRDGLLRFYGGISIPQAVVQAIVRADAFELVAHSTAHGLSDFDMQNMNNLKSCRVQECEKMRYIFEGDSGKLPSLEELKLAKLLSLKDVWKVPVPSGVLMNLKILHIRECPLTKVFSAAVTQQLRKLQELRVESCVQMVGIIEEQEIVEEQAGCEIELGLKILILVGLKNLACICKNGRLRSLERLEVSGCPSLKELPLGQYNLGSLVEIRGERIWWEDLTWENDKVKERLQGRCYLA
ncbi:Disease resistance protein [Acorus gramineus]|uniref:Disease resistance protein n=1 Tax=Acorus gramineus TaxID=55184 RepID=A0AAV9B1K5_ACOGR|nr:Disease resistance protein [Acorus gramineus]